MKCSYDGCEKEVCSESAEHTRDRMHFCQEHHDEITKLVDEWVIPKVLGWWVKANGGAKKLAGKMMEGE